MFDMPLGAGSSQQDAVLEALARTRAARRAHEVRELVLAAELADVMPGPDETAVAELRAAGRPAWAVERTEAPAGPHAPRVSEFAAAQLCFAVGGSLDDARCLLGVALTLRHRLPRLWRLLTTDSALVPVWKVREVAVAVLGLCPAVAGAVDRRLSWHLAQDPWLSSRQVRDRVREAHYAVEQDAAEAAEEVARTHRGVWVRHEGTGPGTSSLSAMLDSADALDVEAAVTHLAQRMAVLGDTDPEDVRRARALGLLAHPQRALALDDGDTGALVPRRQALVHLHLTPTDLGVDPADGTTPEGASAVDLVGPVSVALVRRWLGPEAQVRVRPVLREVVPSCAFRDPVTDAPLGAVDTHDPPVGMAELVRLRDATCVFPGCSVGSGRCQLDHVEPYLDPDVGGPPGQTHPDNLAPVCATHHRFKTHHAWHYERLPDGRWLWRSPTGLVRMRAARPAYAHA